MIKVQPIYRCRACGEPSTGAVMEVVERPFADLLAGLEGLAPPSNEPHNCDKVNVMFGSWEYVGFYLLK